MKTFAMGDIHGNYHALCQCLERSGLNYQEDILIQLGDIVDGHEQVFECVEELLKIRNLIPIKGNHDQWLHEFIETDLHPYYWNLGGKGTLISYLDHSGKTGRYFKSGSGYKSALNADDIPLSHKALFKSQMNYYIDEENRCFVHGGFDRNLSFFEQEERNYYWNRTLWDDAWESRDGILTLKTHFSEIYIGHTQTLNYGSDRPMHAFNIINLDTGAGSKGRLTIMDVDTKNYWQSEPTA